MNCDFYAEPSSAMLDGELSPAELAALTAHLATCPGCVQRLAELAALHAALQADIPEEEVPPAFYAKISSLLAAQNPGPRGVGVVTMPARTLPPRTLLHRSARLGWLAATAMAAVLAMTLMLPHHDETKDLMSVRDAALRGGIGQNLGETLSGPVVPGFRLVASHTDIVAGHRARVLAYTRQDQTITLCLWPANGEPAHGIRNAIYQGMAISYWNNGRQEYWAATTGSAVILNRFVAGVNES
ncbi:MAG: zf-HC2 domain-containing protein [Acidiphilium sp.]|nr:zf-HC2 domain-containing protein [Acidiphilium sp.]MDD4935867.1 zf-HC2 domain-containing protein [Acidiphilium sp.]